ncbi:hypothetical protein [Rubripirellula amarantea]|uniref:hypothetical protein n=1 Tax=Rubripirellula amarantea TaxID=2527999 RepID=UPI0011B7F143|nr:hypothetical protein [Rubripirellula amarantea]
MRPRISCSKDLGSNSWLLCEHEAWRKGHTSSSVLGSTEELVHSKQVLELGSIQVLVQELGNILALVQVHSKAQVQERSKALVQVHSKAQVQEHSKALVHSMLSWTCSNRKGQRLLEGRMRC